MCYMVLFVIGDRHYRTDQTLSYHFSRCHAKKRVYHPCPICKMNFPNHHYATKHIIHGNFKFSLIIDK